MSNTYNLTIVIEVINEQSIINAGQSAARKMGCSEREIEHMNVEDALFWIVSPDDNPSGAAIRDIKISQAG